MTSEKLCVLFVDDEPNVLSGLRRMLRCMRGQWDIEFAPGGEAAMELLCNFPANVIVTDMRMPGMDGSTLLEAVAQSHPHTMRVVLSGQAERDATFRVVNTSHQFLQKPCDQSLLVSTIDRFAANAHRFKRRDLLPRLTELPGLTNLPDTNAALIGRMETASDDANKQSPIVHRDIALAAKLLKLTNSAYFGVAKDVLSPRDAMTMIGTDFLTALLNDYELVKPSQEGRIATIQENCHAMGSALRSRLQDAIPSEDRKHCRFLLASALLAPLGRLALTDLFPEDYAAADNVARMEHDLLGHDHFLVGAALCDLWGLPLSVAQTIRACSGSEAATTGDDTLHRKLFQDIVAQAEADFFPHKD